MVNLGKINGISDIRDESDKDGMRIVIELKKEYNRDIVISNLYKKTSLQSNFGAIFLALINGKPVQLTLRNYLDYFLDFREETIRKRTNYFLKNTIDKLEILEGLSKATKNIKEIIEIIQNSNNSAEAKSLLINNLFFSQKQANAVLDMPLKKLTNIERKQLDIDIRELEEKKNYLKKLLNERDLLLDLLIKELTELKAKYNVKRKTKILKNINQENETETLNKQILDDHINKKTKLCIDNRLYLKKMIFNNYKKSFENENKLIDNKNLQKFICDIHRNLKIIGVTFTGKVFQIDWETCLNFDYKLDKKTLGNIDPNEIINFHTLNKEGESYLCVLNSDGKFKKVLFDEDMIKSNRAFTITKLKNNIKVIDSFIIRKDEEKNLIVLTSIGRILKFNLSNKFINPTTKQSQGIILTKLLPTEKIVCCTKSEEQDILYFISKKGTFFTIKNDQIYYAHNYKLGYLNEKSQLKNDSFIKILTSSQYLDIETNKNKSARVKLDKFNPKTNKKIFEINFLGLENDEYLENCFRLDNFIN